MITSEQHETAIEAQVKIVKDYEETIALVIKKILKPENIMKNNKRGFIQMLAKELVEAFKETRKIGDEFLKKDVDVVKS